MSEQLAGQQEVDGQLVLQLITQIGSTMRTYRELHKQYGAKHTVPSSLMESVTADAYEHAEAILDTPGIKVASWQHQDGEMSGTVHGTMFKAAEGSFTFMIVPTGLPLVLASAEAVPASDVTELTLP